ncbi:MAG: hypothetical protein N3A38_06825, partial [Planctomycetota bacterium]|nr:hypothetical protein [Planctomycetota bacterium]
VLPGAGPAGQGDKVIRHLASGVLGKNAPWPFRQDSLAQEIEWDGRDDLGNPAPAGCKVKVGLGLDARLDRILGWSPGRIVNISGFAVGPDGKIYVLSGGHGTGGNVAPSLRVFDSAGVYLRQICPPPATATPEKHELFKWNRTVWGAAVPARHRAGFALFVTAPHPPERQTPVVTGSGRFLWTAVIGAEKELRRVLYMVDVRDGTVAPEDVVTLDAGCATMGGGPLHMALSPDDRWLYFGSPETGDPKKQRHAMP